MSKNDGGRIDLEALRGFTPGPWNATNHFDDDSTKCDCAYILDGGHAGGIAQVFISNGIPLVSEGGNDAPCRAEAAANARLIAAAPSMHAELTARRARDAEVEALVAALKHARDDIASLPRSLAYGITSLPKIDAALKPFTGAKP